MSDTLSAKLKQLDLNDLDIHANARPESNVFDIFKSYISSELASISGVDRDLIYPALETVNNAEKGDLLIPIPRLRVSGAKPVDLAKKWAEELSSNSKHEKYLKSVVASGPFIQFSFNPQLLTDLVVSDVLKRNVKYGSSSLGENKTVIVEFSSPNIAKPFHAGHLRSTIIGGTLANLHEQHGFDVKRINYLGDWGKQFGLLAVGFDLFGDAAKLEADPINHLFEIYVKTNKAKEEEAEANDGKSEIDDKARDYFRRMESGDEEAKALWAKLRDLSITKYKETYARLNIVYDKYSGESQVSLERMQEVLKDMKEKGLTRDENGAVLVDLTKYQKRLGKTLVQKSDGTTLYITRDIGEAINRYETYKFDKMLYVAASQQDLHFAQFFKILECLDYDFSSKLQHITFGMVQGMSTRKGTVVFLDTILEETKQKMHEVMQKNEEKYSQIEDPEKVADLIGISAVMVQDMASKRVHNYEFDWKRMFSFEGDTGPYLQYAHSRLCSIQRKSDISEEELIDADLSLLTEPCATDLVRLIAAYPNVLENMLKNLEPSTVLTYLFRLTHAVSSCYDVLWVAGQERPLAVARLALYQAARQVVNNGMRLLGLTPVERM